MHLAEVVIVLLPRHNAGLFKPQQKVERGVWKFAGKDSVGEPVANGARVSRRANVLIRAKDFQHAVGVVFHRFGCEPCGSFVANHALYSLHDLTHAAIRAQRR